MQLGQGVRSSPASPVGARSSRLAVAMPAKSWREVGVARLAAGEKDETRAGALCGLARLTRGRFREFKKRTPLPRIVTGWTGCRSSGQCGLLHEYMSIRNPRFPFLASRLHPPRPTYELVVSFLSFASWLGDTRFLL